MARGVINLLTAARVALDFKMKGSGKRSQDPGDETSIEAWQKVISAVGFKQGQPRSADDPFPIWVNCRHIDIHCVNMNANLRMMKLSQANPPATSVP